MRHNYFGKKLSRTKNERRRLFMILIKDLFRHGQIKTTLAKAKAVSPLAEKLITKAKKGAVSLRSIEKVIGDRKSANEIISEAQTRFKERTSGFTRIIKLGSRLGDASEQVLLSFTDAKVITEVVLPEKITEVKSKKTKIIKKPVKKSTKAK